MRKLKQLIILMTALCFSCRKADFVYAPTQEAQVSVATRYLKDIDFGNSGMRGFNLSRVQTLPELKAKNIPAAAATKANIGRIWITASHDANDKYSFTKPETLKTLDSAVKVADKTGMYLMITLEVLPNQGGCDLWGKPTRKDGVISLWRDSIAPRYKDSKIVAGYDLINEPRINSTTHAGSVQEYIDWQVKMISEIRKVDTNHVIAVEVLYNGMLADPYMAKIVPIKNLIYSPHGYGLYNSERAKNPDISPNDIDVTHQGTGTGFKTRLSYPSKLYPSGMFTSNPYWTAPMKFAKKYNEQIWVGEFSCINWAPKNSAGQWTSTREVQDAIIFMESQGWSWSYHAWREYQGWDAEIPSSYYVGKNFVDAAPYPKPSYSEWTAQRSSTAPTISMLGKYFALNNPIW